jgi:hypothetical protein
MQLISGFRRAWERSRMRGLAREHAPQRDCRALESRESSAAKKPAAKATVN